ncbi:hypothetical protein [Mesorhizobium sp. M0767]|uniref:hypothetical protein n=1 Tax=unclassified Mesorhizobium TaxID=325217 RepID=UPI00333DD46D
MDFVAKIAVYAASALALVWINLWFVKFAYQGFVGGDVAIEPVQINGVDGKTVTDDHISRMIVAQIASIQAELDQSLAELKEAQATSGAKLSRRVVAFGVDPGARDFPVPKAARFSATLFSPTAIDAKISGVDVGALLPRIQRWFVQDRILRFSVLMLNSDKAIVSGDVSNLNDGNPNPVWIETEATSHDRIARSIALALVQSAWSTQGDLYRYLNESEFGGLVDSIITVSKINRRALNSGSALVDEYKAALAPIVSLAQKFTEWHDLCYFAGSVAESGGDYSQAIRLREDARDTAPDETISETLEKHVAALNASEFAKRRILVSVKVAQAEYDKLFETKKDTVGISIIESPNAYWDGAYISAGVGMADIPDITYDVTANLYLKDTGAEIFSGTGEALGHSYADVLASYVKQVKLGQTAATADWVIGEGAVAWFRGEPEKILTDRRPFRSLKAPGTAYDDDRLARIRRLAITPSW